MRSSSGISNRFNCAEVVTSFGISEKSTIALKIAIALFGVRSSRMQIRPLLITLPDSQNHDGKPYSDSDRNDEEASSRIELTDHWNVGVVADFFRSCLPGRTSPLAAAQAAAKK
jgi:hypothetical protein